MFWKKKQKKKKNEEDTTTTTTTSSPTKGQKALMEALYAYEAQENEELSFAKGEELIVVDYDGDFSGWWNAIIKAHPERKGAIPANFMKLKSFIDEHNKAGLDINNTNNNNNNNKKEEPVKAVKEEKKKQKKKKRKKKKKKKKKQRVLELQRKFVGYMIILLLKMANLVLIKEIF